MWNPSGGHGRADFGVNPPSLARLLAIELVCKGSSSLNRPPVIAPTFRLQIFLSIKNRWSRLEKRIKIERKRR